MFLKEAKIKNFRSIKDVSISFDDTTMLIGENNAGKTTVLDAIRMGLYKASGRSSFDDYDFFMDTTTKTPKESEGISIILVFEERHNGEWEGTINDIFMEIIQFIDDEKASIILETGASFNEVTGDIESKNRFLNEKYEPIEGRAQNLVSRFLQLTPIFYLQALRDIKNTFSATSPLWGRFMKKASIPQDELEVIKNQIEQLNTKIISNDNNLTNLLNELQKIQKVMDFQGENLVSINAVPLKTWDLLSKSQVVLNNGTSSIDFPLDKHGQGTQSVTAILLFKAYINILLDEISSEMAEAILTLEEPEAHLHPQATRALYKSIEEIHCQKIITTHSPYFIENANIKNIRYLKKYDGQTKIHKIADSMEFYVENISEGLKKVAAALNDVIVLDEQNCKVKIISPINESIEGMLRGCCKPVIDTIDSIIGQAYLIFSSRELYDINMYIQRNRGDILFARKWFLYEGQTEDVIIPYFAKTMGKDFDELGISGIMYRNNGSAGAFTKLAKVLDIPWILLGDNDGQGKKTKKEIINCGYSEEYVDNNTFFTNKTDIEKELVEYDAIRADYETFIELSEDDRKLEIDEKHEEYKKVLVDKIKAGKVESAYRLVNTWEARSFSENDVPELFKNLIKKV